MTDLSDKNDKILQLKLKREAENRFIHYGPQMLEIVSRVVRYPGGLQSLCRRMKLPITSDPFEQIAILEQRIADGDRVTLANQMRSLVEELFPDEVEYQQLTIKRPSEKAAPTQQENKGYRLRIKPSASSQAGAENMRARYPDIEDSELRIIRQSAKTSRPSKNPSPPPATASENQATPAGELTTPATTETAYAKPGEPGFVERRSGIDRRQQQRRSKLETIFQNHRFGGDRRSGRDRRQNK